MKLKLTRTDIDRVKQRSHIQNHEELELSDRESVAILFWAQGYFPESVQQVRYPLFGGISVIVKESGKKVKELLFDSNGSQVCSREAVGVVFA